VGAARFGTVLEELREFGPNCRLRIVPQVGSIAGATASLHRARRGDPHGPRAADDAEGFITLVGPMLTLTGRRNLRATAAALQRYLERE
jgi:hypothetical protein